MLLLAGLLAAPPAARAITLSAGFDSGSLDVAASSVAGDTVTLVGRDNFNPGQWKWVYFAADGVSGVRPTFEIGDNFATGGSNLNTHEMVYSYDGQAWQFFDNNARFAASDLYRFSNDAPFTSDRVYVAYGLPYPAGRATEHTQSLQGIPWVAPTASADSGLVIGQSPGGVDDLGRTIDPQPLYGYRITDPAATGRKAKVVLLGGVHSNETLGSRTLEAMVDYLTADTLEAALLRRGAEFYVYPMANPDGRLAGYNRSTVEKPTLDPNRFWDPPAYGGQSEIAAVATAILADTAGSVDFFIDFHSTVAKGGDHFGYVDIDRGMHLNPVWRRFLELEPTVDTLDAGLVDDTAAKFGFAELGARFTTTFETRFLAGENADRFVALGENLGRAFADTLAPLPEPGDVDLDGDLDADDWLALSQWAQADLAGLSALEAYTRGDLNADGRNDVHDFALFKAAYQSAHGDGAWARLLTAVPEPGAATLLALAGLAAAAPRSDRFATRSV